MDFLLALKGRLLSQHGDEEMNPHYPIPGEEDLTASRPIHSTGLTVSMDHSPGSNNQLMKWNPVKTVNTTLTQ
jgi:hypothetical protein